MPTSPLPTHLAWLLECIECLGRFGEPQLQLIIIMETCVLNILAIYMVFVGEINLGLRSGLCKTLSLCMSE